MDIGAKESYGEYGDPVKEEEEEEKNLVTWAAVQCSLPLFLFFSSQ